MKKLATLVALFGLILLVGTMSYATDSSKAHNISGEITAVDSGAKTLTVKDEAGKETVLQIVSGTSIKQGEEAKTMEDLKSGSKVEASCKEVEGKIEAESISLR
jgi:Cu/Ag efflux protein CusF